MATIDLQRFPLKNKPDDPYQGQALHSPPQRTRWEREHRIKLPPIPDFRFESAYLSALKPFINKLDDAQPSQEEGSKGAETEKLGLVSSVPFDYGVPIRINWPAVLWVTLRDQVLIQFVTGGVLFVWAYFSSPLFGSMRVGLGNAARACGNLLTSPFYGVRKA